MSAKMAIKAANAVGLASWPVSCFTGRWGTVLLCHNFVPNHKTPPSIYLMKISHKLILSFLLVASLASVTMFFTLRSYVAISKTFAILMDDPTRSIEILTAIRQSGERIVSSTSEIGFINGITGVSGSQEMADEEIQLNVYGYQEFETSIDQYRELQSRVDPLDTDALANIRASGESLISTSKAILELRKRNIKGEELMKQRHLFEDEERVFLVYLDDKLAQQSTEQVGAQENVESSISLATKQTLVITVLAFMVAIFSGFYISFLISRRIKKLKEASQKVGEGELDTQIDINSRDEIGDLSRSFNKMIGDLKGSRVQIETQHERLDTIIANVQGVVWETKTKIVKGETFLRFDFVSDYIETMLGYSLSLIHI